MAPWPEQGNEPKAPDKSCSKSGDSSLSDSSKVNSGTTEDLEVNATANKTDDKQPEDKNPDVSNLDDGQLKALLDEAITYKRPKDREGKSELFRELLLEAEADESNIVDVRRGGAGAVPEQVVPVSGSRYYNNSNRRRGRRDTAVSERQTRGGSLQNLFHAFNSEFDTSGFGYFSQSSGHSGGVGRRKSKRGNSGRDYSVSVSARQREGGSLPSNVNVGGAGGGMLTLSGLEFPPTAPLSSAATAALLFDDARGFISKQNKQRKELGHTLSANEFTTAMPVHSSTNVSYQTGGESPNNVSQAEFMVVDLGDLGEIGQESKTSGVVVGESAMEGGGGTGSLSGSEGGKLLGGDICNNGMDEEVGTEMEVIQRSETTRVPNYTSRATLEVGLGDCSTKNKNLADGGDVDTTVAFPLGIIQCEKSGGVVNGLEQSPLQLPSSYNSVKCIVGSTNNGNREDRNSSATKGSDVVMKQHPGNNSGAETTKTAAAAGSMLHSMYPMQHVSVLSIPPTRWIATSLGSETVSRLTFHGSKDTTGDGKNKSLDENGNAVHQNYRLESTNSNDRKSKQRRMKTNNDRNVIMSQNIKGHRGDKDIESLIEFIESNTESKGKTKNNSAHNNGPVSFGNKQQRNNVRREEVVAGTKARRERAIEDGHDEEKTSGKNRMGGKQSSKEHRGSDKVGGGGGQLKKSNSLEEISKTKLEDLTTEQSGTNSTSNSSSCSSSCSAQVTLRRPKKQATLDDEELYSEKGQTADRRSWGTEEAQQYYCNDGSATVSADESGPVAVSGRKRRGIGDEKRRNEDGVPAVVVSAITSEETEFHVVTKKQRRKKRRSSSGGRAGSSAGGHGGLFGDENRRPAGSQYGQSYNQNRGDSSSYYQRKGFTPGSGFPPHDRMVEREGGGVMLYQYRHHHRPRSPEHLRRKSTSSMPPSDKSDSSDHDSVHSLPVSSTTPKLTLDQTSTSSGSTPQASYADITRMASSNVSSSSSTQGSCNVNAGKWPSMTATKGQAVPSPATTTTTSTFTTTTTTTSTISSTAISSSNATATSTSITTSTTIVPAVATPLALNNPQFITGPRLNIGVPPVCGSKATTSTSANSSNNPTCTSSNSPIPPSVSLTSVTTGDAPSSTVTSQNPEASYDSAISSRHRNNPPPSDPRTKKDAMTSTTLDYKLIPMEEHNPSHKLQVTANKPTDHQSPSPNVIMDNYYPSLEESLVSDKVDRKPSRCSNSSVHSNTSSKSPTEENPFNINAANPENCGKGPRHPEICGEIRVKQQPIEMSVETTVIVPRSSSCSPGELVPREVPVASAASVMMASNTKRSKEAMVRSKSGGRKVSATGSNVAATSSVRPPVIIMDEQEQEATFRENVGTVSELTFGFEVNEQLLLSDGDENSRSPSAEPPSVMEEAIVNTIPTTGSIASDTPLPEETPIMTSNAGEDFSARYREPVTQQADNHDLIVTFVGLAWDDVLKEMSATPVQAGGRVQYYSGQ